MMEGSPEILDLLLENEVERRAMPKALLTRELLRQEYEG